jgi:hypothetical protein
MVRKIYKLASQHILVYIRLCPNLMCIWVQKMLWGIEISKIDFNYMKLCKRYIQLWIMCGHTLLKLYNFLYKSYGQKYVATPICKKNLTKFRYYYNYYVVIRWKKFELSLEDIWIFHLYLGYELQWNMWAKKYF